MFLVPLRGIDLNRMNGLGLISVLPASSLAGAWLLALAFILALGLRKDHPVMLGAMLAAIVICLDGVTVITEPEPRFATAYQIAGFVDYISRTGHTAPGSRPTSAGPGSSRWSPWWKAWSASTTSSPCSGCGPSLSTCCACRRCS